MVLADDREPKAAYRPILHFRPRCFILCGSISAEVSVIPLPRGAVHVGSYHWPAFNLADSAIVIGALLLVSEILFSKSPSEQKVASGR